MIEDFTKNWKKIENSPNKATDKRIEKCKASFKIGQKSGWVPLYLGKSKKLSDRINKHIKDETSTTYSLKLEARKDMFEGIPLKVNYIKLPTNDNYYIMKHLENLVREKINPIIGNK